MRASRQALRRASNALAGASSRSGIEREVSPRLLRHHLHDMLYAPRTGYFTRGTTIPVGTLKRGAIAFTALTGMDDYFEELNRRYASLGAQWLTPGEIFAPHYAHAVARYVLETHAAGAGHHAHGAGDADVQQEETKPLRVYEIGGGTGTFANGFLDYCKEYSPEVYKTMVYTSIDISSSLSEAQRANVKGAGHGPEVHRTVVGDAANVKSWGSQSDEACFVIALEVLDNLPHDRVWRPKRGVGEWMQTEIVKDESGALVQRETPLKDELIKRTLQAIQLTSDLAVEGGAGAYAPPRGLFKSFVDALTRMASSGDEAWFVPTGLTALMETLHARRPNHRLVAADFDTLPNVRIEGVNAPLVASQRKGGQTDDHNSYILPERVAGSADVFFPTCFDTVRGVDFATSGTTGHHEHARIGKIMTTKEFMSEYANCDMTRTKSGYNPLLQDFANTKFYLS